MIIWISISFFLWASTVTFVRTFFRPQGNKFSIQQIAFKKWVDAIAWGYNSLPLKNLCHPVISGLFCNVLKRHFRYLAQKIYCMWRLFPKVPHFISFTFWAGAVWENSFFHCRGRDSNALLSWTNSITLVKVKYLLFHFRTISYSTFTFGTRANCYRKDREQVLILVQQHQRISRISGSAATVH